MVLAVADSGCGIAGADLVRIFQRFARAEPHRSRQTGGLRLGLAIVAAHGGSVRVQSAFGHGSVFEVLLLAAPEPAPMATALPAPPSRCSPPCQLRVSPLAPASRMDFATLALPSDAGTGFGCRRAQPSPPAGSPAGGGRILAHRVAGTGTAGGRVASGPVYAMVDQPGVSVKEPFATAMEMT